MCELVTELTKDVQNGNKTGASMTQDIEDEKLVQIVGRLLGYGRVMQICEEEWTRRDSIGALTVGPCVFFLLTCPHIGYQGITDCEWCCGSGRVTKRVFEAMMKESK
jgi:hypothetical protein